jgi:predicted Zn-dependent protease
MYQSRKAWKFGIQNMEYSGLPQNSSILLFSELASKKFRRKKSSVPTKFRGHPTPQGKVFDSGNITPRSTAGMAQSQG